MLYLLYNKEHLDKEPIIAACTTLEAAEKIRQEIAKQWTEECFEVDPKESGLDRELDYDSLLRECYELIGIQIIEVEGE